MSKDGFYNIAKAALIELAEAGNIKAIATLINENINKSRYLKMLAKMVREDAVDDPEIAVRDLIDDNERVDVAHKLLKFTEKPKKDKIKLTKKELDELESFQRKS